MEGIEALNRLAKTNPALQKVMDSVKRQNAVIPGHGFRRSFYNYLKAKWEPAHTGVIIQESFLRSDVLLGTASSYTFSVNESDGANVNGLTILPTTQRINQNDVFEACEWALVVWNQNTKDSTPYSTRRLYTYPNPNVFTGGAVAGVTEADAIESLYNGGTLNVKVGTTTLIQNLDTFRFLRVPTSQEGTVTAAAEDTGTSVYNTYKIARDGYNNAAFPFDENIPFLTLNGNGKNTVSLDLVEGVNFNPAFYGHADSANYVSLYVRGFLVANGAKQANRAIV